MFGISRTKKRIIPAFGKKGFSFIEAMTVIFLITVIVITFYETFTLGMHHILNARNRLGASALANQKMEMIKSLEFDSVGTKKWDGTAWLYGIPPGDILEYETVAASNTSYNLHTYIQFVDDAFDGTAAGSPADGAPADYKRIRLTVSWGGGTASEQIALVATISPDGVESATNTGVLSINVLDSAGFGIPGITVHVRNPAASVDFTTSTDATGNVMSPGAVPGDQNYEITASESGYYGGQTYPPYPASTFSPLDIHASVVAASVNQKSLVIDREADITVVTEDPFGAAIPNMNFSLVGGRQIGTVVGSVPLAPEWAFAVTDETDGSGEMEFEDESYGQYTFTLDNAETGYELYKIMPDLSSGKDKFDALPGESKTAHVVLLNKTFGSLLVAVKDAVSAAPVAAVSVRLYNTTLGYDATVTSDMFGLAFFPTTAAALAAGTYDYEITAAGYVTKTGTFSIGGGALEKEMVDLTAA